jgi:ankyrin repeat protein
VARLLLEFGADPNAHTMKGNADKRLDQEPRRFTALTGVFGGGSTGFANQPPHPQWREFAELLLRHGADPSDEQALAINQDASLPLLLQHGLNPEDLGSDRKTLMGRALFLAARRGNAEQVSLLLNYRARTDEQFGGKLVWEQAMGFGHFDIAPLLEQAGAPRAELNAVDRFVSFCMAGDETAARAMLTSDPDLFSRAPKDLVHRAVSTKRKQAVKLVLDLGFDPNWQEDNAAIHEAGVLAENDDVLRALLAGGASLKLRDPWYDGTGIGWAEFFAHDKLRDKLLSEPDICLLDALDFGRYDRVPDILARDPGALNRPFARCISRDPTENDSQTPLARMMARGNEDAVGVLREHGARD